MLGSARETVHRGGRRAPRTAPRRREPRALAVAPRASAVTAGSRGAGLCAPKAGPEERNRGAPSAQGRFPGRNHAPPAPRPPPGRFLPGLPAGLCAPQPSVHCPRQKRRPAEGCREPRPSRCEGGRTALSPHGVIFKTYCEGTKGVERAVSSSEGAEALRTSRYMYFLGVTEEVTSQGQEGELHAEMIFLRMCLSLWLRNCVTAMPKTSQFLKTGNKRT